MSKEKTLDEAVENLVFLELLDEIVAFEEEWNPEGDNTIEFKNATVIVHADGSANYHFKSTRE